MHHRARERGNYLHVTICGYHYQFFGINVSSFFHSPFFSMLIFVGYLVAVSLKALREAYQGLKWPLVESR